MGVVITLFISLMNWGSNPGRDKDISHQKTFQGPTSILLGGYEGLINCG
jgi:hypothetical protein